MMYLHEPSRLAQAPSLPGSCSSDGLTRSAMPQSERTSTGRAIDSPA